MDHGPKQNSQLDIGNEWNGPEGDSFTQTFSLHGDADKIVA